MRRLALLLFLLCPCWMSAAGIPSRQVYDRHGILLQDLLSSRKTYVMAVPLEEMSPWLIAAAVAAEDKRFFLHNGVDTTAILRALWQNAKEGTVISGASTITQQLVRTLSPRPKNLWGKLTEAAAAISAEKKQTKEEILEQYFNSVEFGNLTQGVEAASRFYFNCSSAALSLSQYKKQERYFLLRLQFLQNAEMHCVQYPPLLLPQ